VGAGAFFRAAKRIGSEVGSSFTLLGTELHAEALKEARAWGLAEADLHRVELRDFLLDPPSGPFPAIAANPPYIRHHRLPAAYKEALRNFCIRLIGRPLDGRAGLHVYFLLRALERLDHDGGRLAFIVPADTCEGVFAVTLWSWISRHYRLDAVVTFDPEATPFPGVDINPVILMIRRAQPGQRFHWARLTEVGGANLKRWIISGFTSPPGRGMTVRERSLAEGLETGFSRPPSEGVADGPLLRDFASVLRGIATGANDFFFLTRRQVKDLGLPSRFVLPAVGRTRDVPGDEIHETLLQGLDAAGRPTLLFCPDGRPLAEFPSAVRRYLEEGERRGLPERPLIASRRPWYRMEIRKPPPLLFAYLGRRNARFIRNLAGVVPLTGFLCVYPRTHDPQFLRELWRLLRDPATIDNLRLVGKSYGAGCLKVEPRALERLPLPCDRLGALLARWRQARVQPSLPLGSGLGQQTVCERPSGIAAG